MLISAGDFSGVFSLVLSRIIPGSFSAVYAVQGGVSRLTLPLSSLRIFRLSLYGECLVIAYGFQRLSAGFPGSISAGISAKSGACAFAPLFFCSGTCHKRRGFLPCVTGFPRFRTYHRAGGVLAGSRARPSAGREGAGERRGGVPLRTRAGRGVPPSGGAAAAVQEREGARVPGRGRQRAVKGRGKAGAVFHSGRGPGGAFRLAAGRRRHLGRVREGPGESGGVLPRVAGLAGAAAAVMLRAGNDESHAARFGRVGRGLSGKT